MSPVTRPAGSHIASKACLAITMLLAGKLGIEPSWMFLQSISHPRANFCPE